MSGEGGGIILGGILITALAPLVVGAAAVGAASVGAYHLARMGYGAYRKSAERKQLRVDQCSAELSGLFDGINQRLQEQRDVEAELRDKASRQVEEAVKELESFKATNPSTEKMTRRTIAFREEMHRLFIDNRQEDIRKIREESRKDIQELISARDKAAAENDRLVQWEQQTETAKAAQRVYASGLLRDAEASVRLAQSLKGQYPGSSFDREVNILESSLASAREAFENGLFQTSSSQSQAIVSRCVQVLTEHEQAAIEAMELQTDLMILVESLEKEVEERRKITFDLPDIRTKKSSKITEDLNDFSQGELEKLQESIRGLKERTMTAGLSEGELLNLQRQYGVLRKNANTILSRSSTELLKYYDRMAALEVIADAMRDQNYTVDWALPEGDDPTQKMVVHFTNRVSGNTVSVTLDQEMGAEDIKRLAMDILFYYESGAPVPEEEKDRIRAFLNEKLTEAGLSADVNHCKGHVNRPSPNTLYSEETAVMEKQPRPLFTSSRRTSS